MLTVTQEKAIANLPRLIDEIAEQGGEIVVTRDRIAIARIGPVGGASIEDAQKVRLRIEERVALLQRENIYPDRA